MSDAAANQTAANETPANETAAHAATATQVNASRLGVSRVGVGRLGVSRVAAVYGLIAIAVAAYWPSFRALHATWVDTGALANTHGYLIAAICLWLVWRKRDELGALDTTPYMPALALVLLLSAAWVVFHRAGIQALHLLLIPPLLGAAVLACFGWSALRVLAFPIVYFVFALPVWEVLSGTLQAITSFVVSILASIIGLPAYVEGNFVHIPAGVFEVENGCSGLHYLVTGLALAALYGEIHRETIRTRTIWFALMCALALISNWIRVFTIIVAGHLTDMQSYLVTVDHYYFGWVLFGVIVAIYFWIAARWPAPAALTTEADRPSSATPTVGHSVGAGQSVGAVRAVGAAWLMAGASLIAIPALAAVGASFAAPAAEPGDLAVTYPGGWTGPHAFATDWKPSYPAATGSRAYTVRTQDAHDVDVYRVWYREQSQDAEIIGSANALYGVADRLSIETATLFESPDGDWREEIVRSPEDSRYVIRYRYGIGARTFARPVMAQVWYGLSSLTGPQVSMLEAYRARCEPDCDAARQRIHALTTTADVRSLP